MKKSSSTSINEYYLKNKEKRYEFKIYCGVNRLTGKPMYTTRRGFKSKKEANLEMARLKLQISKGEFKKTNCKTYKDVYDLWIVQYEKSVEESTFIKTIGVFKNHILPSIGDYKIDKINIETCQVEVNNWASKIKNFRMIKAYASKVIDFAIKREIMNTNPFTLVEVPKKIKRVSLEELNKPKKFYTKEQLNIFLDAIKKETNKKAYVLFRLLAFTGMRKGEALALSWNDIDFEKNELKIYKAIARGKNNILYLKATKTGTTRTIKLDAETLSILNNWKKEQELELALSGFKITNNNQLVFSNERNEFLQPTKTRKWLLHVINKYNLPIITTHGFRHTHCSILFEAGFSLKEVQDRIGHSDVKTTLNIYTHVAEHIKVDSINKLVKFMNH